MKPWLVVFLTLALAGCAGSAAEIPDSWISIIEAEAAKPASPPAECSPKGDPKWREPPEGVETRDGTARRERANKDRFRELAARRRVCAAGLVAATDGGGHAQR